jgi:glycogen operon protein
VPLLLGGDELGRTQRGNNNAYCQDNPISWVDWNGDDQLVEFIATLLRIRREHAVFRRGRFFTDGELVWRRPDGTAMQAGDWRDANARAVAVGGSAGLLLVNAWWEPLTFRLPDDHDWTVELDTANGTAGRAVSAGFDLAGRSLALLSAS